MRNIITEDMKQKLRKFLTGLTWLVIRSKITPNILTITSLPMSILAGYFFARGQWWIGIIFLLFVGLLDTLDGEVARKTQKIHKPIEVTTEIPEKIQNLKFQIQNSLNSACSAVKSLHGAFLDSVIDRFSEFFIFFGFFIYYYHNQLYASLVFITLISSILVSYIRARAEGIGQECKIGLFERPVRFITLLLGLIILGRSYFHCALLIILLGNIITIFQRIYYVLNKGE